jgi:acyl dehydratase
MVKGSRDNPTGLERGKRYLAMNLPTNSLLPTVPIAEGHITDEALREFKKRVGKQLHISNVFNEAATREAIVRFCNGIGDANPLYRQEEYAIKSPFKGIIAPPSWLHSVFPSWVLQGLPGVHVLHMSTDWEFHQTVYAGDTIKPECYFSGFEIKQSHFGGRSVIERQEARYFNQRGELVAVARPTGLRVERDSSRAIQKIKDIQLPHPWTEQELQEVGEKILKEEIRGADPRYWEDVTEGDELPTLIKGPLGLSDIIAYCNGAAPVQLLAHELALQEYNRHPAWYFRDPQTCALEPIYSVHYNKSAANACGIPYPYDIGVQRHSWLMQLLTNWMGDSGWLKRSFAKFINFVFYSDAVWITGKITKKYIDGNEHCVDIETSAINQRGEETMPGISTIVLPSKIKTG